MSSTTTIFLSCLSQRKHSKSSRQRESNCFQITISFKFHRTNLSKPTGHSFFRHQKPTHVSLSRRNGPVGTIFKRWIELRHTRLEQWRRRGFGVYSCFIRTTIGNYRCSTSYYPLGNWRASPPLSYNTLEESNQRTQSPYQMAWIGFIPCSS